MRPFLSDFLLLLWALTFILGVGLVLCHRFFGLRGLELIGFGSAVGIAVAGLLGLIAATVPALRFVIVLATIILTLAAVIYGSFSGLFRELYRALSKSARWSLGLWLAFNVFCLSIIRLNVVPPAQLPDGLFIFKTPQLNVKIQYMVGLPVDNYIPFVVSEYFIRGISFKQEHPIIPGQEVSNRTILMSLAALPFYVALAGSDNQPFSLRTFRYVGRDWPDVGKLNIGHRYEKFLVLGILLNSFLLLGLFVFASALEGGSDVLVPAFLLCATNAYFITQTIFIWPKSLAAFFILLSWHGLRRGYSPMAVACYAGLAYHAHPTGIIFAGGIALFYLVSAPANGMRWRNLLLFGLTVATLVLPWLLWTTFYLKLPSNLISQNLFNPKAPTDCLNFVWMRLKNLFDLFAPTMFGTFPFDLRRFINGALFSLPGAVGLLLIIPAVVQLRQMRAERLFLWSCLILPALAIVLIFSIQTIPAAHMPAVVGALVVFGVIRLRRHRLLCALQLLGNLAVWKLFFLLWQEAAR